MKPFAVLQPVSVEYSAVVVGTGPEVPHADLPDVAKELRSRRVAGMVVFDLLTSNGSRTRRFFALAFDGEQFDPATRLEHVQPSASVRAAATGYLHDHFAEVDLSLLSPAMRFAVEKGMTL